jgi:hypothetical protein
LHKDSEPLSDLQSSQSDASRKSNEYQQSFRSKGSNSESKRTVSKVEEVLPDEEDLFGNLETHTERA